MRKLVPCLLSSLWLLTPTSAHTSGEVPIVTYRSSPEPCAADTVELIFQAPAGAGVSGRVVEVGTQAPPTPFALAAGAQQRVSVRSATSHCDGTLARKRTWRVLTTGAAPFDVALEPKLLTLSAGGPTSGPAVGITTAQIEIDCASGLAKGEVEVQNGPAAQGAAPVIALGTIGGVVGKANVGKLHANEAKKVPLRVGVIAGACTSTQPASVGIESPASSKALAAKLVKYAKVN